MALQITPWERGPFSYWRVDIPGQSSPGLLGVGIGEIEALLTGIFTALGAATQTQTMRRRRSGAWSPAKQPSGFTHCNYAEDTDLLRLNPELHACCLAVAESMRPEGML